MIKSIISIILFTLAVSSTALANNIDNDGTTTLQDYVSQHRRHLSVDREMECEMVKGHMKNEFEKMYKAGGGFRDLKKFMCNGVFSVELFEEAMGNPLKFFHEKYGVCKGMALYDALQELKSVDMVLVTGDGKLDVTVCEKAMDAAEAETSSSTRGRRKLGWGIALNVGLVAASFAPDIIKLF